jgi:hypothetical protein
MVQKLHAFKVACQPVFDDRWQHGNPIFVTFAFAHHDLVGLEVEVLYSQP